MDILSLSSQQWLFTEAQLALAPSIGQSSGYDQLKELTKRKVGVQNIQSLCQRLFGGYVPRKGEDNDYVRARAREFASLLTAKDVTTTASIFFHRYYMRHSFRVEDQSIVAAACLYLALKVEERQTIKIYNVARVTKQKFDGDDRHHEEWYCQKIAQAEESLLETLCYDLALEQPLALLCNGGSSLHRLSGLPFSSNSNLDDKSVLKSSVVGKSPHSQLSGARTPGDSADDHNESASSEGTKQKTVMEAAYHLCYETNFTPLCVLVPPQYIAVASYLLAVSLYFKKHNTDVLRKVDDCWMEAFGTTLGLGVNQGDALAEFREKIGSTVDLILKFSKMGLMSPGMEQVLCRDYEPTPPSPPPVMLKRTKSPEAIDTGPSSPKRQKLEEDSVETNKLALGTLVENMDMDRDVPGVETGPSKESLNVSETAQGMDPAQSGTLADETKDVVKAKGDHERDRGAAVQSAAPEALVTGNPSVVEGQEPVMEDPPNNVTQSAPETQMEDGTDINDNDRAKAQVEGQQAPPADIPAATPPVLAPPPPIAPQHLMAETVPSSPLTPIPASATSASFPSFTPAAGSTPANAPSQGVTPARVPPETPGAATVPSPKRRPSFLDGDSDLSDPE